MEAHSNKDKTLGSRGDLFVSLSDAKAAAMKYMEAVKAFDQAVARSPKDAQIHIDKGVTLGSLGNLCAAVYRHEEAQTVYADTVATFEHALSYVPEYSFVHLLKAMALFSWGMCIQDVAPGAVTRGRWEEALVHAERALIVDPEQKQAAELAEAIRQQLDSL